MALFDPAVRAIIESAHIRAIYGLFKGRAGDEDTVLMSNNVANLWTYQAKAPDPADDTVLVRIIDSSGTVKYHQTYQGNKFVRTDNPYERWKGTEASGRDFRWYEDAGSLKLQENTGTEGVPVWTDRFTVNLASGNVTVGGTINGVTITSVDELDGFDASVWSGYV